METRTYNVYKYDELTKEQQEKVLDNLRDINVDYDDWSEFLLDDWKQKLEATGFDDTANHGQSVTQIILAILSVTQCIREWRQNDRQTIERTASSII